MDSYTRGASDTLAFIQRTFRFGSADYFFQWGREQADGAITGTLLMCVTAAGEPTFASDDSDDGYARRVGVVRIEADGTVSRFPHLSSRAKKNVN
jgi:hypothetical protein